MQSRGFSRLAITLLHQPLWKVLGDARISEGTLHFHRLASGLHFCLFERWEGISEANRETRSTEWNGIAFYIGGR